MMATDTSQPLRVNPGSIPPTREGGNSSGLDHVDAGPLGLLQPFDIRNGSLADVRSLLCKATLPDAYHWIPITGLPPSASLKYVTMFIRCYKAAFISSALKKWSEAKMHKMAIVMGIARATMTAYYQLTPEDLMPGETKRSYLTATPIAGERYVGQYNFTINPEVPADVATLLRTELSFTDSEMHAFPAIHISSVGIPPVQGYSIEMTGHHYLSSTNNQSYRAYLVMERAHWISMDVANFFEVDKDDIRDMMWHKSGHPINLTLKRSLAYNKTLPTKLTVAGAGPSASRLPAEESQLRAANSYKTLIETVSSLFTIAGGRFSFTKLLDAIDLVHKFPSDDHNRPVVVEIPPGIPQDIQTRFEALDYLQRLMDANSGKVAYCYGFYCALTDSSSALGTDDGEDTLKTSFSLKKLKTQSHASYIAGFQGHGDYAAARSKARAEGLLFLPKYEIE